MSTSKLRSVLENNIEHFGKLVNGEALARKPTYEGMNCLMVSVVNLLSIIRESFSADNLKAPARHLLHRTRADALVIIDDIEPSDCLKEQLYALIDLRCHM